MNLYELSDLCTPWCIHTVATLRIAEHIAAGKQEIEALAAAARCDAYVLHCVLRHLASKGVFEEAEPGRFLLNETSLQLLEPGAHIGLDLQGIGGRMARAWGTMFDYVKTGAPAYHKVFGRPFWEDLEAHPDVSASFDALIGMIGHGMPNGEFEISGGWEPVRTVVDVGGGTGLMLAQILKLRPWVRGILVDQPGTVGRAVVHERMTAAGQSFFDPLPGDGDVYLLRGILNDWPDRETIQILRRCAEAAGANGRVVVLKSVSEQDAPRELSIEGVLLGGRHRSVAEFEPLAKQAGLKILSAGRQTHYFVVECGTE